MHDIWLITGGGRSGKSEYAEKLAAEKAAARGEGVGGRPGALYIATGVAMDDEMAERIEKHRASRPEGWVTWERCFGFADIEREFDAGEFDAVLLDCVANLLMAVLFEEIPDADNFLSEDFERVERRSILEIDALCDFAKRHDLRLIFVTNEVGMGVIPATRYSRYYRDALGRINKYIAKVSDRAVLMVAGIPMVLK